MSNYLSNSQKYPKIVIHILNCSTHQKQQTNKWREVKIKPMKNGKNVLLNPFLTSYNWWRASANNSMIIIESWSANEWFKRGICFSTNFAKQPVVRSLFQFLFDFWSKRCVVCFDKRILNDKWNKKYVFILALNMEDKFAMDQMWI